MKAKVRVWGNDEELLVGVIYWKDSYYPFATFSWKKDPRVSGTDVIEPDMIGQYMDIEFEGVTTDLQAANPLWISDCSITDGKDSDLIFIDLSPYEAWLRKKKIAIPGGVDEVFFKKKLRAEKSKAIYQKSKRVLTIL